MHNAKLYAFENTMHSTRRTLRTQLVLFLVHESSSCMQSEPWTIVHDVQRTRKSVTCWCGPSSRSHFTFDRIDAGRVHFWLQLTARRPKRDPKVSGIAARPLDFVPLCRAPNLTPRTQRAGAPRPVQQGNQRYISSPSTIIAET